MNTLELIGTIGGSVLGSSVLSTFITNWFNRPKLQAEADVLTTDNALKIIDVLQQRVDKLEAAQESMRRENLELHKEVAALRAELGFYRQKKDNA